MQTGPIIEITSLCKHFGEIKAADNISFEVLKGEIFGFLGPNGAGKTTTIRMMLDLLKPTSGSIKLFGLDLATNSYRIRKRCGYLPGNFSAYANLTGIEFLHLCADIREVPRAIDPGLIDRFGLGLAQLDRKIKYLSHGTMQKLGMVQAFFHHPELLILDEATIGLDPLMQEAFYELLADRRNEGCTIFISSHNLSEVERICHRMAIIRAGVIEKVDSLDNLRKLLHKRLKIKLSQPLEGLTIPGARLLSQQGPDYEFEIDGEIGPVLKALSELPVQEVILPEPRLDEIFINFYREDGDD
jgi:ABC-2 type transport system ATP-binding protein